MSKHRGTAPSLASLLIRSVAFSVEKVRHARTHLTASATLGIGYVAQLAFQMGYFVLLTRMLGVERFGQFAAALAAIAMLAPLSGIGYAEVALLRVSSDRKTTGIWVANTMATTFAMGGVFAVLLALASAAIGTDRWLPWHLIFGLAISELVLVRCCLAIGRIHQARRDITRTAAINTLVAATKALVAFILFMAGYRSILLLVLFLNLGLSITLFLFLSSFARLVRISRVSWFELRENFRLSISFGLSVMCKVVYTDLDKLFLTRWSNAAIVGTYSAGYKILALSFMPMRAILEATFPRTVELADKDRSACVRFSGAVLLVNVVLGGLIALTLYVLAPYAIYLFGAEFEGSIAILRIGFLLPVIQAIHYTCGNFLTATGYQWIRTFLQIVVLVTYVIAGIVFIPLYSWYGAIWTSLACEALLAILFAIVCVYLSFSPDFLIRKEATKVNPEPETFSP
ncbi:Polysaccharide biosynthesis protein [Novipirellula aureliae]|uniref:Polysaccharide biosynthesis protein n=1 Tax=Novipirellula aureliae TaxID=2527966 RepID=A0A5C6E7J6_9BACT|nr:oligosaccharide flippase family protein [Novipirellula aureliae]TWU43927.1 Polysaccharide biosynthesis protein [Novipirellula aureliae]